MPSVKAVRLRVMAWSRKWQFVVASVQRRMDICQNIEPATAVAVPIILLVSMGSDSRDILHLL